MININEMVLSTTSYTFLLLLERDVINGHSQHDTYCSSNALQNVCENAHCCCLFVTCHFTAWADILIEKKKKTILTQQQKTAKRPAGVNQCARAFKIGLWWCQHKFKHELLLWWKFKDRPRCHATMVDSILPQYDNHYG